MRRRTFAAWRRLRPVREQRLRQAAKRVAAATDRAQRLHGYVLQQWSAYAKVPMLSLLLSSGCTQRCASQLRCSTVRLMVLLWQTKWYFFCFLAGKGQPAQEASSRESAAAGSEAAQAAAGLAELREASIPALSIGRCSKLHAQLGTGPARVAGAPKHCSIVLYCHAGYTASTNSACMGAQS